MDAGWDMTTIEEHAIAALYGANACSEHHSGIDEDDIASVIAAFSGCYCEWYRDSEPYNHHCDSMSTAVLLLKDGRYAVIHESSDTTGHG